MSRFRDFDAYQAEVQHDPIEFQLGGRRWTAAHVNHVNFLVMVRAEMDGKGAVAYDDFVRAVIAKKERTDFEAMLQRSNVSLQTFAELSRWIVEQATGAPLALDQPDTPGESPPLPSGTGGKPRVFSLDTGFREDSASAAG